MAAQRQEPPWLEAARCGLPQRARVEGMFGTRCSGLAASADDGCRRTCAPAFAARVPIRATGRSVYVLPDSIQKSMDGMALGFRM